MDDEDPENQRFFQLGGGKFSLGVLSEMNAVAFERLIEQAKRAGHVDEFLNKLTPAERARVEDAHPRLMRQLLSETGQQAPAEKDSGAGCMAAGKSLADDLLGAMVGLEPVKDEVRGLINTQAVHKARGERGLPAIDETHHLVFLGNPGTGKTAVAGILGKIYCALGVVSSDAFVEVGRADLVGQHVGETALKTEEQIRLAMDGVLFIDEAYSLAPPGSESNDFGGEAVTTLVQAMEEHRNRLVVIVAGYKDEMERFIESNPGLRSRFKHFIHFADYEVSELREIFLRMCKAYEITVPHNMQQPLLELIEELKEHGSEKGQFGNAREMRKLFQNTFNRHAARIVADQVISDAELRSFELEDLPEINDLISY